MERYFSESEKRQKKKMLVDYLYTNLKNHNFWAYKYFFCEFLGLLNISGNIWPCKYQIYYTYPFEGQMFLMDRFFDGTFFTFGIEVLSFAERDQEDRIDPMVCKGSLQKKRNICYTWEGSRSVFVTLFKKSFKKCVSSHSESFKTHLLSCFRLKVGGGGVSPECNDCYTFDIFEDFSSFLPIFGVISGGKIFFSKSALKRV